MSNAKFNFLSDITTADLAFEAYGTTYNELFENAALALESAMVNLKTIEPSRIIKINLEADYLENLLYSFLEELVLIKDKDQMLFNRIKCEVKKVGSEKYEVRSKLSGEKINPKKQKLGVDVKAVTKHLFIIEKLPDKTLRCQVILDV